MLISYISFIFCKRKQIPECLILSIPSTHHGTNMNMNAAVPALSRVYRNQCGQCPDRNTYVIIQHCSHCIPHLNAQLVCGHQSFVPKLVRLYRPDLSNFARLFASCLGQYHQIIGVNPHIERHQGLLHTKRMHVVFASHQARHYVLNGGHEIIQGCTRLYTKESLIV